MDFGVTGPKDSMKLVNKLRNIKVILSSLFKDTNNYVEINGHKSLVLGRIGMKNFVCDISNIDAKVADKVKIPVILPLCDSNIERKIV